MVMENLIGEIFYLPLDVNVGNWQIFYKSDDCDKNADSTFDLKKFMDW